MSPNTIASAGHASWHAVLTSFPERGRPCSAACWRASAIRWMQNVHFYITPRERTVTSGLCTRLTGSCR